MPSNKQEITFRVDDIVFKKLAYLAHLDHRKSTHAIAKHFTLAKLEEYEENNGVIVVPDDWSPDE